MGSPLVQPVSVLANRLHRPTLRAKSEAQPVEVLLGHRLVPDPPHASSERYSDGYEWKESPLTAVGPGWDIGKVARAVVTRWLSDIHELAQFPVVAVEQDLLPHCASLIEVLHSSIACGPDKGEVDDNELRDLAVRRFHQGVSLEGLLRSYRLWGRTVLHMLGPEAQSTPSNRMDAGLQMAEQIMRLVDHVSLVVTEAFRSEASGFASDRSLLRGDQLTWLLHGEGVLKGRATLGASALAQSLKGQHIVMVVRFQGLDELGTASPRGLVEDVRSCFESDARRVILGYRHSELVCVYPLADDRSDEGVRAIADRLAKRVKHSVVGMGRSHAGLAGVPLGYAEAAEASAIAIALKRFDQATSFRDVVLHHIARTSDYSGSLIADTVTPLREYDAVHEGDLVATLCTYFETKYNLARTGKLLHVHPNTVAYRLRRIQEITGLDPNNPDDLLLLSMGLKLGQLYAGTSDHRC